jgi:hypothetical protein
MDPKTIILGMIALAVLPTLIRLVLHPAFVTIALVSMAAAMDHGPRDRWVWWVPAIAMVIMFFRRKAIATRIIR